MASKQASPGCVIIFGLVFAVLGSIPGFIALHAMTTASEAAGWSETTAMLLDVDLERSEDAQRVVARYRYSAPDPTALEAGAMRDYEGDRVGVHTSSDNIGDWQQQTYRRLHQAWKAEKSVPCWYDPTNPAEAVLDRDQRPGLLAFLFIFPLVFGLAGGGLAIFGFVRWRRQKRGTASSEDHTVPPPVPAARLVRADHAAGCVLLGAAVFWNAISWTLFTVMLSEKDVPWPVLLVVGIFPLIGIILALAALLTLVRGLRHGRSELRLEDEAWATGQRIRATVLTRTAPQPGDRIEARIAVTRSETTGTGKNRRTVQRPLWNCDLAVDAQASVREGARWAHTIELPLPGDLPLPDDVVTWRLEWHLIRPGPDLSATFTLPVTTGSGELRAAEVLDQADRAEPLAVLHKAGVRIGEEHGDVVLRLPALRNPSLTITGLVVTVLLSGGAFALATLAAMWTALLSVPILLLCWRGTLRSAFWRSTIVLSAGRVAITSGWWRMQSYAVPPAEIAEIKKSSSTSTNNTAWYDMWLITVDGQRIPIVRAVPERAAVRIAELIEALRTR